MAAIGCKFGIILIYDMLSKEVVRSFSIYNKGPVNSGGEFCYDNFKMNTDVDQFMAYRKVNFSYGDDDFVYQQN